MSVTCYLSSRFGFISSAFDTVWAIKNAPVKNTMLWDFPHLQAWWEYHDGIFDLVPRESVHTLWQCLQHRDKNKKFIYVKPNFSETRCVFHKALVEEVNGALITCPKWSYYENVMPYIHQNRHALRKQNKQPFTITFLGKRQDYTSDKSMFIDNEHPYGVAGVDATLFGKTCDPDPVTYERCKELDRVQAFYGDCFFQRTTDAEKVYYSRKLSQTNYSFQPHGVGLRHSVYESIALGTPCIIPEISYLDDITRNCSIIYDGKLPSVEQLIQTDLAQLCIDTYETHMTPEKIVNNVLQQLKNV